MDSLSQFILGAAIGQVVLGRHVGRKAALIGGLVATLPDCDRFFINSTDVVAQLTQHRGISHSVIGSVCGSAIGAFLSSKWLDKAVSFKRWYMFWFLAWITHIGLDCFTSWGTQIVWPLSYRVAFHSIFIIDPFYTIPLLIGVILTWRSRIVKPVWIGLLISTLYLGWTLGAKQIVNAQFEKGLQAQGIVYKRYMTRPTPFNTCLWAITVDTDEGYYSGYYSLLDKGIPKTFWKGKQKGDALLEPYQQNKKLQQLLGVTQDFYAVEKDGDDLVIYDCRYGLFGDWDPNREGVYIFTYRFNPITNESQHTRPRVSQPGQLFRSMIKRLFYMETSTV